MSTQPTIEPIDKLDFPTPSPIPFKLLLKPDLKASDLWSTSPTHYAQKGEARIYDFPLKMPVLITRLEITTENYASYDTFELSWKTLDGSTTTRNLEPEDGVVRIEINELIIGFSFKPPSKIISGKKIISVQAEGLGYEALEQALHAHDSLTSWKKHMVETVNAEQKKLSDLERNKAAIVAEIEAINHAKSESERSFKAAQIEQAKAETQLETVKKDLETREVALDKVKQELSEARNTTAIERDTQEALQRDITSKSAELRSLKEDISLFPTELKSFSTQGTSTSLLYMKLSLLPVIIIAVMAFCIVNGAGNLAVITMGKSFSEVIAILISRTPYVTVVITIIGACYGIAHFLLSETVKINRQKLNLNKISIIATDVSKSAEIDLNQLNEEELYEKRIQVKMLLLRDHLKTYLSNDKPFSLPKLKIW